MIKMIILVLRSSLLVLVNGESPCIQEPTTIRDLRKIWQEWKF